MDERELVELVAATIQELTLLANRHGPKQVSPCQSYLDPLKEVFPGGHACRIACYLQLFHINICCTCKHDRLKKKQADPTIEPIRCVNDDKKLVHVENGQEGVYMFDVALQKLTPQFILWYGPSASVLEMLDFLQRYVRRQGFEV